MRKQLDTLSCFALITLAFPALAHAEAAPVLAAAGNGPWIALAVIGMLRAVLCLGHRCADQS